MKYSILLCCVISFAQTSFASNYPPEFFHQRVRLIHREPAVFANVSNGFMSKHVIGYKNSGLLAQRNPESIQAVLYAQCAGEHEEILSKTTQVTLGREWHGTGYMSFPLDIFMHFPKCTYTGYWALQISFVDANGQWDSRYGQNYHYTSEDLYGRDAHPAFFDTHEPGAGAGTEINGLAWDFIVEEMKK